VAASSTIAAIHACEHMLFLKTPNDDHNQACSIHELLAHFSNRGSNGEKSLQMKVGRMSFACLLGLDYSLCIINCRERL